MEESKNSQNILGNFFYFNCKVLFLSQFFHSIQKGQDSTDTLQLHCCITHQKEPLRLTKRDTPTFHLLQKVKLGTSKQKVRTSTRVSDLNYESFLSKP